MNGWSCRVESALNQAGLFGPFFARSSLATIRAQAPSEVGHISSSLIGCASGVDRSTSSSSIFLRRCAWGFLRAFPRFFTATFAACSSVIPNLFMYSLAASAKVPIAPDMVARSKSGSDWKIKPAVVSPSDCFSQPIQSAQSNSPLAT